MIIDFLPIWVIFVGTIVLVVMAVEAGIKLGAAHRTLADKEESSASTIAGALLGLLAFMLAFAFGMVTSRYDARKALVCEEANAITTAYLRSDFMSEPDRSKTKEIFKNYLDTRIALGQTRDTSQAEKVLADSDRIKKQLWGMAVANAFKDMNSDVAALYVDALNKVIDMHATRVAVGLRMRVPKGIWLTFYIIIILSMISVGYQAGISGSTRRSWATPILALAFSLVIVLIASLDRPQSGFITISQQPLIDARNSMNE